MVPLFYSCVIGPSHIAELRAREEAALTDVSTRRCSASVRNCLGHSPAHLTDFSSFQLMSRQFSPIVMLGVPKLLLDDIRQEGTPSADPVSLLWHF